MTSSDFDALKNAPPDPEREQGLDGRRRARRCGSRASSSRPLVVGDQHLGRPLARHRLQRRPGAETRARSYKKRYGLDVKFVLLEDPAAKLAAFRKGDVDIMWDTVDNWAREASILAEQNQKAKSIIMQDWSRGGDGIVSLTSIKSIEELQGAQDRLHAVHAVALPASLPALAVGPDRPTTAAAVEKNIIFTQDAPAAAAMFKAKQVDAAVTWEPDLSGAVTARGDEAHVLVSTTAATNIIADTLCARQDVIDQAPETVRDFVHGWFDGIEMIKKDPVGSYAIVAQGAEARHRHRLRHALGPEAHAYADNAQFYGLTRRQGALRDAVRHGVRHLAQEGPGDARRRREGLGRHALPRRARRRLSGRRRSRSRRSRPRRRPSKDRAIINKQIQIHFTPGSDEIMPGSFFVLDSLGDTMTSFGNTYLRVEGNTDATGIADREPDALGAPRAGGQELHREELPEHPRPRASRRSGTARRIRSPPTRPRPAGSSTAAPTSRSSWRPVTMAELTIVEGPRGELERALRPVAPRCRGVARRFGARLRRAGAGARRVVRHHVRRPRAARLPAVADRGPARHAAALRRSTTSGSAILVSTRRIAHRVPPRVGAGAAARRS